MTLEEVKKIVNTLSISDILALKGYINTIFIDVTLLPPKERIRQLEESAREIRAEMTPDEFERMLADMDREYIEPLDDDSWID